MADRVGSGGQLRMGDECKAFESVVVREGRFY